MKNDPFQPLKGAYATILLGRGISLLISDTFSADGPGQVSQV